MAKIPCRKCDCGLTHDISVKACGCGRPMKGLGVLTEPAEIPAENVGIINPNLIFFVQKCSGCGAFNFTFDASKPEKVCMNCHKPRIATVKPVPYVEETKTEEDNKPKAFSIAESVTAPPSPEDTRDDASRWGNLKGNILQATGQARPADSAAPAVSSAQAPVAPVAPVTPVAPQAQEDDDDEAPSWGAVISGAANNRAPQVKNPRITFEALTFGNYSFSIEGKIGNEKLLIGRTEEHSEFLSKDPRVSGKHCYIEFRNGKWFVKDNHSTNGTFVNNKDIGLDGEAMLFNGDQVKLGHHADSMAFIVRIS